MRNTAGLVLLLLAFSSHAATLNVRIDRGSYAGPLTILVGPSDGDHEPHWKFTREVKSEDDLRFENLESAMYVVSLRGSEPAQKLTTKTGLAATDERTIRFTIPNRRLTGKLTLGDAPLRNVAVWLEHQTWRWTAKLETSAEGRLDAPLWDEGEFLVDLRGGGLSAPVKLIAEVSGAKPLDLALPARSIRGTVVDDQGRPVANAKVILRADREDLVAPIPALTRTDGTFEYPAIEPGAQTIRISADGYLTPEPVTIIATADDSRIERKVVLTAGTLRTIELVGTDGKPVANATVLSSSDGAVRAMTTSDASGRARIGTPRGATAAIWILAPNGSLAALRVPQEESAQMHRVVVPDVTASLDVDTLLADGTPVPNVTFLMRYNGELVPPDVAKMWRRGGNSLSTNRDGRAALTKIPAGTYELWPYTTADEAAALVASASGSARAPIHVSVGAGPHRATMRLQKRH